MINSFGTGKPTEADGERGSGGSCSAVRAVRLFGCSAVRTAAALLPRMASGERSEAPTAAGASSSSNSRFQQLIFVLLFFCGCRLSAAAAGSHPPTTAKSTDVLVVVLVVVMVVVLSAALLPRMASGER